MGNGLAVAEIIVVPTEHIVIFCEEVHIGRFPIGRNIKACRFEQKTLFVRRNRVKRAAEDGGGNLLYVLLVYGLEPANLRAFREGEGEGGRVAQCDDCGSVRHSLEGFDEDRPGVSPWGANAK